MAAERRPTDAPEAPSPDRENAATEGPRREQLDWESLNNAEFVPDPAPSNGDLRRPDGAGGDEEAPEENDDNPYQESDEALPDDREERAIGERNRSQDPSMRRD